MHLGVDPSTFVDGRIETVSTIDVALELGLRMGQASRVAQANSLGCTRGLRCAPPNARSRPNVTSS